MSINDSNTSLPFLGHNWCFRQPAICTYCYHSGFGNWTAKFQDLEIYRNVKSRPNRIPSRWCYMKLLICSCHCTQCYQVCLWLEVGLLQWGRLLTCPWSEMFGLCLPDVEIALSENVWYSRYRRYIYPGKDGVVLVCFNLFRRLSRDIGWKYSHCLIYSRFRLDLVSSYKVSYKHWRNYPLHYCCHQLSAGRLFWHFVFYQIHQRYSLCRWCRRLVVYVSLLVPLTFCICLLHNGISPLFGLWCIELCSGFPEDFDIACVASIASSRNGFTSQLQPGTTFVSSHRHNSYTIV